jgi:hypothetical protein
MAAFTAFDQVVENGSSPRYHVRVFKNVSNVEIQGVILCDTDGNAISVLSTAPQMVTITPSRPSFISGVSSAVIAANTSRKAGSYLVNNTTTTFYLNYGIAAVSGQGVPLLPGAVLKFDTTQAINAIQSSGGALNLDVFEAT